MVTKDIVNALKRGESWAHRASYDLCAPKLLAVLVQIFNDRHQAEDILQESFIAAFDKINSLQEEMHFYSWLKRIAINKSIRQLQSKRYQYENEDLKDEHHVLVTSGDIFDNGILQVFTYLDEQSKLVVWMYVVEEYNHYEIAALFNKSVSFSKSIVSRSLAILREKCRLSDYVE
ncbi:RNA polymerase sigma factor [Pseudoalteromonas fenneropenaei]|uniref:RNA polymerase sigma factor n=1 Tax=Pseudoalteromonas fenneropenaei TaxID=1737459 RepID=A0ABV7CHF8_9GAMM